jgi:hypothetical protein
MCTSTPKYEAPEVYEAPAPEKAPERVERLDDISSSRKKLTARATGTQALRTDLMVPKKPSKNRASKSGLSIPMG